MDPQLIKTVIFRNWYTSYKVWGWVREIHNLHQCKNYTKYNNITLDWCCEYGTMSLMKDLIGGTDTTKYYDLLHERWFRYLKLVMTRDLSTQSQQLEASTQRSVFITSRYSDNKKLTIPIDESEYFDLFTFIFNSYLNSIQDSYVKLQQINNGEKIQQLKVEEEEGFGLFNEEYDNNIYGIGKESQFQKKLELENASILSEILVNKNSNITRLILKNIKFTEKNIEEYDTVGSNRHTRVQQQLHIQQSDPKNQDSILQLLRYIEVNYPSYEFAIDGFFVSYAILKDDMELCHRLVGNREMDRENILWYLTNYAHGKIFQYFFNMVGSTKDIDIYQMYRRLSREGDLGSIKLASSQCLFTEVYLNALSSNSFELFKYLVDLYSLTINSFGEKLIEKKRMDYFLYLLFKVEFKNQEDLNTFVKENGEMIIKELENLPENFEISYRGEERFVELFIECGHWDLVSLSITKSNLRIASLNIIKLMDHDKDDLVMAYIKRYENESVYLSHHDVKLNYSCLYRILKSEYNFVLENVPMTLKKVLVAVNIGSLSISDTFANEKFIKIIWENEILFGHSDLIKRLCLHYDINSYLGTYSYQKVSRVFLECVAYKPIRFLSPKSIYALCCYNGHIDLAKLVVERNPTCIFSINYCFQLRGNHIQTFKYFIDQGILVKDIKMFIEYNIHTICLEEALEYAITSNNRMVPFTENEVAELVKFFITRYSPGYYEYSIDSIIKYINDKYPQFQYGVDLERASLKGWNKFAKEIFNKHYQPYLVTDEKIRYNTINSLLFALEYGNLQIVKHCIERLDPETHSRFIHQLGLKVSQFYQNDLFAGQLQCWSYIKNVLKLIQ